MSEANNMNDRIANDLIRYAELVEDGALISPEEMNCASLMRLAAEALSSPNGEAQPEQEPVALRHSFDGYGYLYTDMGFGSGWIEWTKRSHKDAEPLYTTPPQRTWVGLSHDEYDAICDKHSAMSDFDFLEAIEAKLKEKNT